MFLRNLKKSEEKATNEGIVKLKNGTEVPEIAVVSTMMNLKELMKKNPIAFYEFVQKCRNPKYEMFGNTEEVAAKWELMNSGSVHDVVKNIVLSAVQGDDFDMTLDSPVEKNSFTNRM